MEIKYRVGGQVVGSEIDWINRYDEVTQYDVWIESETARKNVAKQLGAYNSYNIGGDKLVGKRYFIKVRFEVRK